MRAVLQRVDKAQVKTVAGTCGTIARGLLVFVGVDAADEAADADWLAAKIPLIRCFEDENGRMNRSLRDINGEVLVISQFTLFGNLRKGTRPSFNHAAEPEKAQALYEYFIQRLESQLGRPVPTGAFGEHMDIEAHNNGPVTLILDTRQKDY